MLPDTSVTRKKTEEEKTGLFSRFSKSESAAATIIIAVLLLGLIFTVISVVRLQYVPEWKNEAEQGHMHNLWEDMLEVKVRVDILSGLLESGNYFSNDFSATVPFSLGGGDVPIFESSKSDGKLEVNEERCAITIEPYSPSLSINPYTIECGGITCYSQNTQYPDQIFRYENGGIILADGKNSIMKQPPVFTIEENKTIKGSYTVNIRAVQLLGKADSVSSNTITPLELTGLSTKPIYNSSEDKDISLKAFNLTIATKYPDAWVSYLSETAENAGLVYGTDFYFEKSDPRDPNYIYFKFMPKGNKTLDKLNIDKSIIQVDLRAGSIFSSEDTLPESSDDASKPTGDDESVMKLNEWHQFDTFTGVYGETSISGSTDPDLLKDRNEDYSLPTGVINYPLSQYSAVNDFNYDMEKNRKTLNLNFGFDSFSSFNSASAPTKADVCMIYRFDNEDKSNGKNKDKNPNIEMAFAGTGNYSTFEPGDGWRLYNQTRSMSPEDPEDITLNLKVTTDNGNRAAGTFHIDYLAVRPD